MKEHTKVFWAVQRPDGYIVNRTLSMVDDGHAWSEAEAREFVTRPAFSDWTLVRCEQHIVTTDWEPVVK